MKNNLTIPIIPREPLTEDGPHHFFAEASELGLTPGEWPERLDVTPTIGNGLPFKCYHIDELGGHRYAQECGCVEIMIFND